MKIIAVLIFLMLMVFSVVFRTLILHPFHTVFYAIKDPIFFFKHLEWHRCPTGIINCYTALFGKGKTLSVVHYVCKMYRKYNNKLVWDRERKRFARQIVTVISNVDLAIPHVQFTSLQQIIDACEYNSTLDDLNGTLTVTIVLGDEFSVQMNSRSFKTNIDPLFLNTLLTCRHYHVSMFVDSQRFNMVDALFRQVTMYAIECDKIWRVMTLKYYDAWEMENASSPTMIKPVRRKGFFIRDKDFKAYNTYACVQNLTKSVKESDMLSSDEILALQGNVSGDMESVIRPTRKYIKSRKKMTKK